MIKNKSFHPLGKANMERITALKINKTLCLAFNSLVE